MSLEKSSAQSRSWQETDIHYYGRILSADEWAAKCRHMENNYRNGYHLTEEVIADRMKADWEIWHQRVAAETAAHRIVIRRFLETE